MKCPHCGQDHPDIYLLCPYTGKPLKAQTKVCGNPSCQFSDVPLDANNCPICGFEFTSTDDNTREDSTRRNLYLYDEIEEYREGLARVRRNEKYGFINIEGDEVIPCMYEYLDCIFSNGYCKFREEDFWGVIDKGGTIIVSAKYFDIDYDEDIDAFHIYKDDYNVEGILDKDGITTLIPCCWKRISWFNNGLAVACKNDEYVVIKQTGETVFKFSFEYEDVKLEINNGIVPVKKEGKWGLLDTLSDILRVNCIYDDIRYANPHYVVKVGENCGIIDEIKYNQLIECKYKKIFPSNNAAIVERFDGYYSLFDYETQEIIRGVYKGFHRLDEYYISFYNDNGYCGLYDWHGNVIVRPNKYKIMSVPKEGLIYVVFHDSEDASYYEDEDDFDPDDYDYCGLIDLNGNEVIPCIYESISLPENGIVVAKFRGNYCIINIKNEMIFLNNVDYEEWKTANEYANND